MLVEQKTVGRIVIANKIAIIGPSGAGKTTLAEKLGSRLGLKVYHLDKLFWHHDWKRKDRETRIDILQYLVLEKQWIIEGTYLNSSDLHLYKADAIIFLDISSFMCGKRIIKRHYESQVPSRRDIQSGSPNRRTLLNMLRVLFFLFQMYRKLKEKLRRSPQKKVIRFPRHDIPLGSPNRLTFLGLLKVLFFPLGAKRKLENKLRKFPEKVIRLQSPEAVGRCLAELELHTNEKTQSSPSSEKKEDLIPVGQ